MIFIPDKKILSFNFTEVSVSVYYQNVLEIWTFHHVPPNSGPVSCKLATYRSPSSLRSSSLCSDGVKTESLRSLTSDRAAL